MYYQTLQFIRNHGGYWFGHLPGVRQTIVAIEDFINNRGMPTWSFRQFLVRSIHYATGNTIFYLDYVNGSDANDGSTWALAWKTITAGATAARIAPGDIIRIAKSPAPASIGNATWTNLSGAVALATAQNVTIELCETVWTASLNVTATASTTRKEGAASASLAILAAFTTGKVAYKSFTALDLSAYQKISFWIRNSAAIAAGNVLKVCLCSDTLGDTIVDTFFIPAVPSTARWLPLTLARVGNGNLGAAIQSIAVYADVDPGTVTILLDNFIACTTDGLNLQSLISKNSAEQGGIEGYYGMKSIVGTAIQLDADTNSGSGLGRGYSGITETVATYKRETIKTALASISTTVVQEVQDSGSLAVGNIEFQGGWNTTTTVQEGETYFDGLNGNGYGLRLSSKLYITFNYLNFSRYNYGVYHDTSSNNTITTLSNANNNTNYGVYYDTSNNNTITTLSNANNNTNYGVYYTSSNNNTIATLSNANNNTNYGVYYTSSNNNTITTLSNANNNSSGVYHDTSSNNTITTLSNANNNSNFGVYYDTSNNNTITTLSNANNNSSYGVYYSTSSNNNTIATLSTSGNTSGGLYTTGGSRNYILNALIAEATEVVFGTVFSNDRIFSQKHDQTANNHWIFTDGGVIFSQATTRYTASGIAWNLQISSANRASNYPLQLSIAKIAVSANNLVTVKAWFRRSTTGVMGRLICKGKQIAGVDSDVTASMTAAIDTWEELTITFTPTEAGVVEILGDAYYISANGNVFVDDMTITQA